MILQSLVQPTSPLSALVSEQVQNFHGWSTFSIALPSERYKLYQERGTSISFVSPTDIQLIESLYTFREGRLTVLRFLEVHSFLIPLIVEAYFNIQKDFPYSRVFLRIVSDPEELDPNQADKLVASIATNLEVDKAVATLSRFDKRWWLNTWKQVRGKFGITLEF